MISTKTITKLINKRLQECKYDCEVDLIQPNCDKIKIINEKYGSVIFDLNSYKTVKGAVEDIVNKYFVFAKNNEPIDKVDINKVTAHLKTGKIEETLKYEVEFRYMNKPISYKSVEVKDAQKLLNIAKRNMAKDIYLHKMSEIAVGFDSSFDENSYYLYMDSNYDFSGLLLFNDIFTLLSEQLCSDLIIIPLFAGLLLIPAKVIDNINDASLLEQLQLAQYASMCAELPEAFKCVYRFNKETNLLCCI